MRASYTLSMPSVTALDVHWNGRPGSVASALLESGEHRALIDPGPGSTVETLREGLKARGLAVSDLDAILLTHIHLDHAGATGTLLQENPRMTVYVHENGAHHMADPSKLLASAERLWGGELRRIFGDTLPVPAENLRILQGGETLRLGTRELNVVYTPGHAVHHVSYFDDVEGLAFVGDTTGIRVENGPYIMPATPPPDIDLGLWDASLDAILARHPARLFLTHFGIAENPSEHIVVFRERLHRWFKIASEIMRSDSGDSAGLKSFLSAIRAEAEQYLAPVAFEQYAVSAAPNLSFLGLARHFRKRAQGR